MVWNYFEKVVDSSGKQAVQCLHCSTVLQGWTCHSNIKHHLRTNHLKHVSEDDKPEILAGAREHKRGRTGDATRTLDSYLQPATWAKCGMLALRAIASKKLPLSWGSAQ